MRHVSDVKTVPKEQLVSKTISKEQVVVGDARVVYFFFSLRENILVRGAGEPIGRFSTSPGA